MSESSTPASGDATAEAETEAGTPSGLAALPLPGALAGEFFGTFVLVFFGVGAVNAAVVTGAQAGLWQVAVVWAVGVSLGIYTAAALSGAHINPAITAAAAVWDGFPWRRVVPYWVAQTLGGGGSVHRALRHVLRSDHRVRATARAAERRAGERAQRDGVR